MTSLKAKTLAALMTVGAIASTASVSQAATYGCFKVTSAELNIRDRPYSDAAVIGTAIKGEILEKRKLFCTPRGYWCAIRKGTLDGYADKNFMTKIKCP